MTSEEDLRSSVVVNGRFLTQQLTGVQRYAREMTKQLLRHFPELTVCTPRRVPVAGQEEFPVERCGVLRGHAWEQFELAPAARRLDDAVLVNLCNTAPLSTARQTVTIHDLSFLHSPSWFSRRFYYLYRFLIPRIAQRSAALVTDSEFSRDEIVHHLKVAPDRIKVIPCAAAAGFLERGQKSTANPESNYIVTVSSIDPRKNLKRLVEAYQGADIGDVELLIVGSGSKIFSQSDIGALVRDTPGVSLAEDVDDERLAELYAGALACVYPTLYEGFGLPPLEAMACGCPAVVSRVASLPEVCGDAALYVDPLNVQDIARGIREIVRDARLRAELREKGLVRARSFSWESSGDQLADLVREVQNAG